MDIFVDSSSILTWTDVSGVKHMVKCALGREGIAEKKSEGDGITPLGVFSLLSVMVRSDRIALPDMALSISHINKDDGWCTDPKSTYYNKPIKLPFNSIHEKLYRRDKLYDIIIDVDYNRTEIIAGKGSAIFIHVASPNYSPTQGCVAIALSDLLKLLKSCDNNTKLIITS